MASCNKHLLLNCIIFPSASIESVVKRSWETHTDEPEPQRRHQPSSNVTPNVFRSVKQSLNSCSSQSSWTAAYPPTLRTPALPSLSPCPHPPPQQRQTPLTRTPTGPWGICDSSPPRFQSSHQRWRRESKSLTKTPHTSALRFALDRLSHRPPVVCHRSRCLCWCPNLISSPNPTRWGWLWNT